MEELVAAINELTKVVYQGFLWFEMVTIVVISYKVIYFIYKKITRGF
jgi:hypothetical protein